MPEQVTHPQDHSPNLTPNASEYLRYRSMSGLSVAALIIGIISVPALLFPALLFLPVVGLIIGVWAMSHVRKYETELTGYGLARAGAALSLLLLIGGTAIATTIYVTEVPDGYQRISFLDLQPVDERPELPVSPAALELSGQQVFVKGYIYPDDRGAQLRKFVLVPDMGTCCFGGQPKLTDMIEVTLRDPLKTHYSYSRKKLGGRLKVDTRKKPISGLDGVYYQLDADYIDGSFAE